MHRHPLVRSSLAAVLFALPACKGTDPTDLPADGTLEITTLTSGQGAPASYDFQLDAQAARPIGASESLTFLNLSPGEHRLALLGLPDHCSVDGENPRTITVTSDRTVATEFRVTCTTPTGSLLITTVTTGESLDPDGYVLTVSGRREQRVEINGATVVGGLTAGQYTVTLAEAAPNCPVAQGASREITIAPGAEQSVAFEVTCAFAGAVRWDSIPLPADYTALTNCCIGKSIWGTSSSDLFVTAYAGDRERGVILHYNGRTWNPQVVLPDTLLVAVAGASPSDVYAVGGPWLSGNTGEVVLHYAGSTWSEIPGPVKDSVYTRFYGVWQAPSGEAFLGGYHFRPDAKTELLARFDGVSWSEMVTPDFGRYAKLTALTGTSASDVWAIGEHEKCEDCSYTVPIAVHWDGTRWAFVHSASNYSFDGIFALGPDDVWIAARDPDFNGAVLQWDGATWTVHSPMGDRIGGLDDIWGSSSSDIYAAGHGKLLRYDGSRWSEVAGVGGGVIWGTSRDDVFVLQSRYLIHGRP